MQSRFTFLDDRFPKIADYGKKAEDALGRDNNICLLNLGRIGETVAELLCRHSHIEYSDKASDSAHKLLELGLIDEDIYIKIDALTKTGSDAFTADYSSQMAAERLLTTAQELGEWLVSSFGRSRFDFLADLFQPSSSTSTLADLADFGREAEANLHHNTRYCLICLGDIGETIVDILIDLRGIHIHDKDQIDRINILHARSVIDNPQKDTLHELRMARNKAVHNRYASEDEGKRLLEASLPLCEWMFRLVMTTGDIVRGQITSFTKDGLTVKIGRLAGRVPNTELPDGRAYTEGERRLFMITSKDGEELGLSLRDVHSDPWAESEHHYSRYSVGQDVNAVVSRVTNAFGAFVTLNDGLQARIPESEYGMKNNNNVSLRVGQYIKARVIWLAPRHYPYMLLSINDAEQTPQIPQTKPAKKAPKLSNKKFMAMCKDKPVEEVLSAIDDGANVNAKNHNGTTCLMVAVMDNKNPGVIDALLEAGADVNARAKNGNTALMYAAMRRKKDIVRLLLEHGADVDPINDEKHNALHYAKDNTKLNGDAELLELLGEETVKPAEPEPVPVSVPNDYEFLELCMNGSAEEIKEALRAGANISAMDKNNNSGLVLAAKSNTADVVRLLLEHGANVEPINDEKHNALHYAKDNSKLNGDDELLRMLGDNAGEQQETTQPETETTPEPEAETTQPESEPERETETTPLESESKEARKALMQTLQRDILKICRSGSLEDITQAIDAGVNINIRTHKGAVPLMYAAQKNSPEAVDSLIKAGAEINAQDSSGNTALIYAASYNSGDVVNILLDAGADKSITNNAGYKALDYARRNNNLAGTDALTRLES